MEAFTRNYRAGKGLADLDKVMENWNEWMDDNGAGNYFAMTLTPHYYGENTFDIGWLASWPSGEAMGRGTDLWMSKERPPRGRPSVSAVSKNEDSEDCGRLLHNPAKTQRLFR